MPQNDRSIDEIIASIKEADRRIAALEHPPSLTALNKPNRKRDDLQRSIDELERLQQENERLRAQNAEWDARRAQSNASLGLFGNAVIIVGVWFVIIAFIVLIAAIFL